MQIERICFRIKLRTVDMSLHHTYFLHCLMHVMELLFVLHVVMYDRILVLVLRFIVSVYK